MIISHKHRYVFVELYHTGSTAISRELQEHYDGHRIHWKHAFYRDFLRDASADEKTYFAFAAIRDPLEVVTSFYFKYKNGRETYDDPATWTKNGGWVTPLMLAHYRHIRDTGCSFADYLRKYYWYPYDNWSRLDHHRLDYVMRFESLADDFEECLGRIGIEPVRPLPRANVTKGKPAEAAELFSQEVRQMAVRNFGPFMEKWGYAFPPEWGETRVPRSAELLFELAGVGRLARWSYLSRFKARRRAPGS